MMKKISIFNYEAYYLDYLEGNLSDEDVVELLAFLDKHPELKLEEEELPLFESNEVMLGDLSFLKETDESDAVTQGNYEHFLVAKHEGILTADKEAELSSFIDSKPEFEKNDRLFAAVYFKPETDIVYGDKSVLKQKAPIVLWPYYSGIAAAFIAAIFFLYQPGNVNGLNTVQVASSDINNSTTRQTQSTPELQEANIFSPITNLFTSESTEASVQESSIITKKNNLVKKEDDPILLNRQPTRPIVAALDNKEVNPISTIYTHPEEVKTSNSDVAYTNTRVMENPIEPITKFISEKTKTEVDFRQPKSKKQKGFLVKIGKFELERK